MILAIVLCVIAAHHWQEGVCGHHARCARWSLYAAALAYSAYAVSHALAASH
jgi:hypothetical protein